MSGKSPVSWRGLFRGEARKSTVILLLAPLLLTTFKYYLGWEFFFRGFMQFGLRGALGDWNAILVQTLASCLIHIGKPAGEIYGAIVAGLLWGWRRR